MRQQGSLTATVVAAVIRHPGGDGPSTMWLCAYSDPAAMTDAFNVYVSTLPTGSCSGGDARQGTWNASGATQGPLACYTSRAATASFSGGSHDEPGLAIA